MRDLDELRSWYSDWSGLRVAVLGLGLTGFSVADTLIELGAEVLVITASAADEQRTLLDAIGGTRLDHSDRGVVPVELLGFAPELVVVSPGFRPDHGIVRWTLQSGIPLWGDIELAWRLRDKVAPGAEWLLVAGSGGRAFTASLTAHLLRSGGRRAAAVGDSSVPVLDAVRYPAGFDVLVVALSSAQLHWLAGRSSGTIVPWASVCLGVADPAPPWHGSPAAYRSALGEVYTNTRSAAIYNRADPATVRMLEDAEVIDGARAIGFGLDAPGPSDFGVVDGILCDRAFLEERFTTALELSTRQELAAVGLDSATDVSRVLAASALARSLDLDPVAVRAGLLSFVAVP